MDADGDPVAFRVCDIEGKVRDLPPIRQELDRLGLRPNRVDSQEMSEDPSALMRGAHGTPLATEGTRSLELERERIAWMRIVDLDTEVVVAPKEQPDVEAVLGSVVG